MENACDNCLVRVCCSKVCNKKLREYQSLKNLEVVTMIYYDFTDYEKIHKRRVECKSEIVRISMIQLERKR